MTFGVGIALAGLAFSILCTISGVIIWAVRLEGRLNTTQALFEQHKTFVREQHEGIEERLDKGFDSVNKAIGKVFDRLEGKADKVK